MDHLCKIKPIDDVNPYHHPHISNFSTFLLFYAGCDNASVYGTDCDTPCPTNCQDNTCHIQSGSCFKCKPGWSGMYCYTSKMTNVVFNLYINFFYLSFN